MKQIKEIFGINVANFKEERVFIGTNTGIQWANGHGKSFLIIQYLINLSTRLNYDISSFNSLQTPETNFLASLSLGANDKEVKNDKDKKDNVSKRLEQVFNKNEQKHLMSFTGLYLVDEEKDEYFMVLTYPSGSNVLNLERQFLKLKDKDSYLKIFEYLSDNLLHHNKQLIPLLHNMKSDTISLEIIKDKKNECGEKLESSEYLKEKKGQDDFSLGYKSSMDLGNDLIISTSQKDNSVVEKGLINKTTEKILNEMKDDLPFLFNNNGIAHIFEDYLRIKEVQIDELKRISNNINQFSSFNLKEEFNIIKRYYDRFNIKYINQKNNYNNEVNLIEEEINELNTKINENKSIITNNNEIIKDVNKTLTRNIEFKDIQNKINKFDILKEEYKEFDCNKLSSLISKEISKFENKESTKIQLKIDIKKQFNDIEKYKSELDSYYSNKNNLEKEIHNLKNNEKTLFDETNNNNLKAYLKSINQTNLLYKSFTKEEIEQIENSLNFIFDFELLKINEKYFLNLNENKKTIEEIEMDIESLNKIISEHIQLINKENNNFELLKKDLEALSDDSININNKLTKLKNDRSNLNAYIYTLEKQESLGNDIINSFKLNTKDYINEYLILDVFNSLEILNNESENKNIDLDKLNNEHITKINILNNKIKVLKGEYEYDYKIINTDIEEFININYDFIDIDDEFDLEELNLIELDNEIITLRNTLSNHCNDIIRFFAELNRNNAIINHRELGIQCKSYNSTKSENLELIDYIKEFKYSIDNVVNCNIVERENNLLPLSEKLIKFNHILNEINKKIKTNLTLSLKEIFNIKSNSGHKYYLKKDNYLEDYKLENNFKNSLKEIFHVDSPEEINSDEIEIKLQNTHIDSINNLIKTLKQFNQEYIECGSIEKIFEIYVKDKTKEYEITSDSISTGNKIVLSTNLRNITLHSNKNFVNLLFLDEIGNVDKDNIQILNNSNIDNKVILGNQGFDYLRNYLDVLNQSIRLYNVNESDNEYRFIINEPLWLKGD